MQYPTDPGRRRWLRQWALPAGLALGHPAFAQRAADTGLRAGARMVQLLDMSVAQQELSRDYSTGVRLAWAVEGQKGRPLSRISLETVNTDGSAAAVNAALDRIAQDADILALVGTVGDALAVRVQDGLNQRGLKLPHLGPWMADGRHDSDPTLALLFASRSMQLRKALGSAYGMGVNDLIVVYSTAEDQRLYDPEVSGMAQSLGLKLRRLTGSSVTQPAALAARLPAGGAMILFLATSAEVAQFTQAMARRGDHRFVLALGDVDAPSLMQFTPGRGVPVILTQVVPSPLRSRLSMVETYRNRLGELYDEPPSTISLAGYLAGQYTAALVREAGSPLTREHLLDGVSRRRPVSLGGWAIDFRDGRRGSQFVNPTLLDSSGRLIG